MKIATLTMITLNVFGYSSHDNFWNFQNEAINSQPAAFYYDETGEAPEAKWQIVQQGENRVLAQLDSLAQPGSQKRITVRFQYPANLEQVRDSF